MHRPQLPSAPSPAPQPPAARHICAEDFDRLVDLPCRVDHNVTYHRFLLRHLPAGCARVLDAGCGTGTFTCQLATRAPMVIGIDLSPRAIEQARQRCAAHPHVQLRVGDWMTSIADPVSPPTAPASPASGFDCVASIAALHHLPMPHGLRRLRDALRPGGVLLLLDLRRSVGLAGIACDAVAGVLTVAARLLRTGRVREAADVCAAWNAHAHGERYLSFAEARALCARELPGARVRRHLFWRWSAIWRRPS